MSEKTVLEDYLQVCRTTALNMALSTYTNTTVSPVAILDLASHYADFIIKGEIEWPDDVKRCLPNELPEQRKP